MRAARVAIANRSWRLSGEHFSGSVPETFVPTNRSRAAQQLLILLLPLPLEVELPLLVAGHHCAFPFEFVAIDLQLVLHVELVIPQYPLGGECQFPVLQLHILELRVLLIRPVHRPSEVVAVLLDRQGGGSWPPTDFIFAP